MPSYCPSLLICSSPVVLRETTSAQSRPAAEPDQDIVVTFGTLSIQGRRSGLGRSYRDESYLGNKGNGDDRYDDDDDARDFTACDSGCGYCGGCDY